MKRIGVTSIRLVSVWEEPEEAHAAKEQIRETTERGRNLLSAYLQKKCLELKSLGLEVDSTVRVGKAAEAILEEAEASGVDVITIATHGRSGMDRWRLGSVADKIVRGASCPTLAIGPNVTLDLAAYEPKVIMVPLDGSSIAEQALPLAHQVAERIGANLDLVRVVTLPVTTLSSDVWLWPNPVEILQALEEGARQYLVQIEEPLAGKRTTLQASYRGLVSDELLLYSQDHGVQLVVMTSHARRGVVRWTLGSVTERLLLGPVPVLIVRPSDQD